MTTDLVGLWHFDDEDGPVAWNDIRDGAPFEIRGAIRERGRFGAALRFRQGGDNAVLPLFSPMTEGTIGFWLRLDTPTRAGTIISIHDQVRIGTDKDSGVRLALGAGGKELFAPQALEIGRWTHVATTFGPDGRTLFIDGCMVCHDAQTTTGVTLAGPAPSTFLTICPLPSSCVPCAIDELALFGRALSIESLRRLASEPVALPQQRQHSPDPIEVSAADFVDQSDPTCGLQRAIDAAYPSGGRVVIPAGRYVLRQGLRVHSRIVLTGTGNQSVLAAAPGFESKLTRDAKNRDHVIEVADIAGFAVGDGVIIESPNRGGYHASHARVAAVGGNRLELATPLWSDYAVADGAFVARWFPMISAIYQHELAIRDLAIEGRAGLEESTRVEFAAAAITLERCLACEIDGVQIQKWLHDGICLGKGSWHRVIRCIARDCKGHGFHPGNRMRKCTWLQNMAIHNGQDGFFFCCGVEDNLVAQNVFDGNVWNGIGDLGNCDDERNLVMANQCVNNGRAGILLNGGKHNTVTNNSCIANSRSEPGRWAGIHIEGNTKFAVVTGNRCIDDSGSSSQRKGVHAEGGCESNLIDGNFCAS